jgi:Fic family protein
MPRAYETSHPWITFRLDLQRITPRLWMLLGEAQSKADHIAGVPLLPDVAQDLHLLALAKGAHGTTAIEGNTLTEEQVLDMLEGKSDLPESLKYDEKEVQNIFDACNTLVDGTLDGSLSELSVDLICRLNEMVLKDTVLAEGVEPGKIRTHPVTVGNRYRGAPAEDCEYLLDRLFTQLNEFMIEAYPPVAVALIKATYAHLYLAWIHPFGDGNGRTSRLVELFLLLCAGVSTPAAHLLTNHYSLTRGEYMRQLDQASKGDFLPWPFMEYGIKGFVEELKTQLKTVRQYQLNLTWEYYVHERFKELTTNADRRRRDLLIDISREEEPVPMTRLKTLTTRTAVAYKGLQERTLQRDVQTLQNLKLVTVKAGRVSPRKKIIESFTPRAK